ncbi:BolA family protein [Parathalassolituus penaei]|uniref:BolA family transcriptional regulator n=1 Tax=Parathalassolituus penaei TaxID=2997323 RepID=A0A9X3IQA6_9GAMM|nr:BolA family protein [Parathalassolituus penaei]MCY0963591.1 BolA family transcriptional regulator [Parathalassolituus penaei]
MSVEQVILDKVAALNPEHVQLLNESHMHAGPATDSHFKLVMVSAAFDGKRAVARHQMLYGLLAEELKGPVHALALHLFTPTEWAANNQVPASPTCQGKHG